MKPFLLACLCFLSVSLFADDCGVRLRKLCLALYDYADSCRKFPDGDGAAALDTLLKNGSAEPLLFVCPLSGHRPAAKDAPLTEDALDYLYYGNLAEKVPLSMPLLVEKPGVHKDGFGCLFRNGTVKRYAGKYPTAESQVKKLAGAEAASEKWNVFLIKAREYDAVLLKKNQSNKQEKP